MKTPKSSTETLIVALREIGNNALNDEEGVITAAILEAADRLESLKGFENFENGCVFTPDRDEAMTLERFDELAEEGSEEIDKFMDLKRAKRINRP